MSPLVLILALAPALLAHSRSEGRAKFELDDTGRIDVVITLSTLDMPELCDVDLATNDPGLREERVRLVDLCIRKDLPRLLRVRADESVCPVIVESVGLVKNAIAVDGVASCPSFPERVIVDWGLFAGGPLDHVAVTTFEQPHAKPKLVMFSKRSSKLVVDVSRPLWPKLVAGGAALVAVLGALAGLFIRARRRKRAPAPSA